MDKKRNAQLKDIIKNGKIITFQELNKDLMKVDVWRYSQLSYFVDRLPLPIRYGADYRPLEMLCMREK